MAAPSRSAQAHRIKDALGALFTDSHPIEIRLLKAKEHKNRDFRSTGSGYFSDYDVAIDQLRENPHWTPEGSYVSLNTINPALLSRRANRFGFGGDLATTSDADIIRLNWLLIDFDPNRPAKISATEAEKESACQLAELVASAMGALGWSAPLRADSGNGYHLLYRVDLPTDQAPLLKAVLAGLSHRYSTPQVKIDPTTFNPGRITKLYGSMARKGDSTEDRPHRMSVLLTPTLRPEPVAIDLLQEVAGWAPAVSPRSATAPTAISGNGRARPFDLSAYVRAHLTVTKEIGPEKWEVDCPFDESHKKNGVVGRNEAGALFYCCNHSSCSQLAWRDLTALYNPEPFKEVKTAFQGKERSARSTTIYERSSTIHDDLREEDEEEDLSADAQGSWPTIHPAAYHGLAGRFVRLVGPCSETDPCALLLTFLVCVGHAVTSRPHFVTEADRQTGGLYVCLVGKSSRGRKGTSLGWIEKLFRQMLEQDPSREDTLRIKDLRGLASGEGLIERMKDPEESPARDYHRERLIVIETELAGILKRMDRDGNVLSPILRQGWDGKPIENPTKKDPARVSNPHLSLLGHVTSHELSSLFSETESFNGLGNRILWTCVRRSKYIPIGRQPSEVEFSALADELGYTLLEAQRRDRVYFSGPAEALWCAAYPVLEADKANALVDALSARSAAQVVRLSLIYALLDQSGVIEVPHLQAAMATWSYCEQSVQALHSPQGRGDLSQKVLRVLEKAGESGLTRTEINKATGGNYKAEHVTAAISKLLGCGVKGVKTERAGSVKGKFTHRYFFQKIETIRDFLEKQDYSTHIIPPPPKFTAPPPALAPPEPENLLEHELFEREVVEL